MSPGPTYCLASPASTPCAAHFRVPHITMRASFFRGRGTNYGGRQTLRLRDVERTAMERTVEQQLRGVSEAKKRIFGYACGMPGEEQWLKPLDGRDRLKYYFPNKYLLQNFDVSQYFRMQALRYLPRATHPSIHELAECLEVCWRKRKAVRILLGKLDRRTFEENQSYQDLYAMYRTLCDDDPLSFAVNPLIWTDPGFSWMNVPKTESSGNLAADSPNKTDEEETAARTEGLNFSPKDLPYLSLTQTYSTREPAALPRPPPEERGKLRWQASSRRAASSGFGEAPSGETAATRRTAEKEEVGRLGGVEEDDSIGGGALAGIASGTGGRSRSRRQLVGLEVASGEAASMEAEGREEAAPSDSDGVKTVTVGFTRPPDASEEKLLQRRKQESKRILEEALRSDRNLAEYHGTRHRFFDPLFRRRRLSFLDRLARDRIKGEVARQRGIRRYAQHPDQKETWPDHKGEITKPWPSPFC